MKRSWLLNLLLLPAITGSCVAPDQSSNYLGAAINDSVYLAQMSAIAGPSYIQIGFTSGPGIDDDWLRGQGGSWTCNGLVLRHDGLKYVGQPPLQQGKDLSFTYNGSSILRVPVHAPPVLLNYHSGDTITRSDSVVLLIGLDSLLQSVDLTYWTIRILDGSVGVPGYRIGGSVMDTAHSSRPRVFRYVTSFVNEPPGLGWLYLESYSYERYGANNCTVPSNSVSYANASRMPVYFK